MNICKNHMQKNVCDSGLAARPRTVHAAIDELLDMLENEELFYIGKECGRQYRWGELEALGLLEDIPAEFRIIDAPNYDIFGQPLTKKYNFECQCPRCHRTLAAARFAPHLEKCMGMGRNSSRIASKRLAAGSVAASGNGNGSNSNSGSEAVKGSIPGVAGPSQSQNGEMPSEDEHFEEDEDDEDWTMERKRKNNKRALEKISPKRKGPLNRVRNVDLGGSRGKRSGSPSVNDSPNSSVADTSLLGDEDFTSFGLG